MIELRLDNGEIFKHERTDEGFLRIWMSVSRTGDLDYYDSQGNKRVEIVPRKTLFDVDSLDTAYGKPMTFGDHPKNQKGYHLLDSKNAKYDMVGMTMQSMVTDYDQEHLKLLAVITDQDAIDGIESGVKQVSAAYTRKLQLDGGKAYQVDRRYNHFTILPRGRAGESVSVYYDSFNCDILGGPMIHKIKTHDNSSDRIKSNKLDLIHIL